MSDSVTATAICVSNSDKWRVKNSYGVSVEIQLCVEISEDCRHYVYSAWVPFHLSAMSSIQREPTRHSFSQLPTYEYSQSCKSAKNFPKHDMMPAAYVTYVGGDHQTGTGSECRNVIRLQTERGRCTYISQWRNSRTGFCGVKTSWARWTCARELVAVYVCKSFRQPFLVRQPFLFCTELFYSTGCRRRRPSKRMWYPQRPPENC